MARGDKVEGTAVLAANAAWYVQPPAGKLWRIFDVLTWGHSSAGKGQVHFYNFEDSHYTHLIMEVGGTSESLQTQNNMQKGNFVISNAVGLRISPGTYSNKTSWYVGMELV